MYEKSRKEAGVSLLETIVAVALLGLVAVFFVNGLGTLSKSGLVLKEQALAEGAARSQMEYVKSQPYNSTAEYSAVPVPSGYSANTTITPIDPATGDALSPGVDSGVQKITVTVSRGGNSLLTLSGYTIDRNR